MIHPLFFSSNRHPTIACPGCWQTDVLTSYLACPIRFTTTFIIVSFSSGRLSAMSRVRATSRCTHIFFRGVLFQFHKGSIKPLILATHLDKRECFNSTKVRLSRFYITYNKIFLRLFQFHKGSIKTSSAFCSKSLEITFQFHKGSIKTQICDFS